MAIPSIIQTVWILLPCLTCITSEPVTIYYYKTKEIHSNRVTSLKTQQAKSVVQCGDECLSHKNATSGAEECKALKFDWKTGTCEFFDFDELILPLGDARTAVNLRNQWICE